MVLLVYLSHPSFGVVCCAEATIGAFETDGLVHYCKFVSLDWVGTFSITMAYANVLAWLEGTDSKRQVSILRDTSNINGSPNVRRLESMLAKE